MSPSKSKFGLSSQPASVPKKRENTLWVTSLLLSTLALQMPIILANLIVDASQTAIIALALRVVSAPASLIGAGLAQGFIFDGSKKILEDIASFKNFVLETQRRLTVLSLVSSVVLAILGFWAVQFVFTDVWSDAAWMVLVLAIPYSLQTVNRVLTPVFPMLHASGRLFVIQSSRVTAMAAGLAWVALTNAGTLGVVICIAAVSLLFQVGFSITITRIVSK